MPGQLELHIFLAMPHTLAVISFHCASPVAPFFPVCLLRSGSLVLTPPSLSAAPPKSFLWNILSWTHLLLVSLGLSLLLLVVVSVIGSQSGLQGREASQRVWAGPGL